MTIQMKILNHVSGDQIPMLIDSFGLPLVSVNEYLLSRRGLSPNTLIRNARELIVLYRWLNTVNVDLDSKILDRKFFSESEINGSLIEFLRKSSEGTDLEFVSPLTFNQRLTTIRTYMNWFFDVLISQLPMSSVDYEILRERKLFLLDKLNEGFISSPPNKTKVNKGLIDSEIQFLIEVLNPVSEKAFGQDKAIQYRNYISIGLMLFCGLRPGELLCLKVCDIEFGAVTSVRVERRISDPNDFRSPRPRVKRNGRIIPIDNQSLISSLNEYILTWREELENRGSIESDYLILSAKGKPLSQSSITQLFQILRTQFDSLLPMNLTAKSLRHTFSSRVERVLRNSGMDEQRRRESLALLRGDSSLDSQDVYIAQEVEEQAEKYLKLYQSETIKVGVRE